MFDVDCNEKIDLEKFEENIKAFVINHPIIKYFFKAPKLFMSSY